MACNKGGLAAALVQDPEKGACKLVYKHCNLSGKARGKCRQAFILTQDPEVEKRKLETSESASITVTGWRQVRTRYLAYPGTLGL